MTSERAARANRLNAKASTGPRSPEGKSRSGQNARRHGLSAGATNAEEEAAITQLTEQIADGVRLKGLTAELAHSVAEAHIQLQRVQAYKLAYLRGQFARRHDGTMGEQFPGVEASAEILEQLEQLDRYERRALSHRKSVIRRFYAATSAASTEDADGGQSAFDSTMPKP